MRQDQSDEVHQRHRWPRLRAPCPRRLGYWFGSFALIVAATAWHAWVAASQTWYLDDWMYLDRVNTYSFGDYVLQDYNGHLMPLQFAFTWLVTKVAPMSFAAATVIIAVLSAAGVAAWAAAFAEVFGRRLRLLLPLSVIALTPLVLFSATFWAAALQVFPFQVFLGLAVLYAARVAHGNERARWHLALTYVLALLWWQKALLMVLPIAAVLVFCAPGRIRQHARALLPLAAATIAYLPWYLYVRSRVDEQLPTWVVLPGSFRERATQYADHSWGVLADLVVPSLVGGPWGTIPIAEDLDHHPHRPAMLALSAVVVLAIVVAVRVRGRRSWVPLSLGITYLLTASTLILFSTKYQLLGPAALYEDRYFADVVVVLMFSFAMLICPPRHEEASTRPRQRGTIASFAGGAGLVALLASLVTANVQHWDRIGPSAGRDWVRTVSDELTTAGPVSISDSTPPDDVIPAYYWPAELRTSRMFASLHPEARFGAPGQPIMVFDRAGHLQPGSVQGSIISKAGPQPDCGYLLLAGKTVRIPMTAKLFDYAWGLELTMFSGAGGTLTVTVDGASQQTEIASGLSSAQFQHVGPITKVTARLDGPDASACVTEVRAGELSARVG
ncbi:hypothetical protein [Nocardioides sp.]|uniref:hypothetical protein n=1 Tax=Nocardioides sp. TaxID=35761 RepID=UPI00286DEC6F|nr:hypothetical protein [Nocardioides sp.]